MVIRADESVAAVLRREPGLVEVFVQQSPVFARLRNPMMRSTMARLVTVEQAARIGGVDPASLLARLNAAIGAPDTVPPAASSAGVTPDPRGPMLEIETREPPPALRDIPADRIVDVDVRDDLRAGREPFARIMAGRRSLPADGVLRLRAIFEPAPLYAVMAKQGFDHWTERLADDDWRVWFFPAEGGVVADAPEPSGCSACHPEDPTPVDDAMVQVLDVRGLEPPEPMARTLAALQALPPGGTLVQLNVRFPQFLLPHLEREGYTWEVREQSDELVRVFIRRRGEG
jgi:uncharacterized protein (DUF2249 family)